MFFGIFFENKYFNFVAKSQNWRKKTWLVLGEIIIYFSYSVVIFLISGWGYTVFSEGDLPLHPSDKIKQGHRNMVRVWQNVDRFWKIKIERLVDWGSRGHCAVLSGLDENTLACPSTSIST